MISEQMKSSIPSVEGSTREERLASGGPWWWVSTAWVAAAMTYASAFAPDWDSMCSTGTLVASRTRSTSLSATHCDEPSGRVEMRISEMWKYCTAFITAV